MNFVHISSYDNYLNAHMQLSLLQEQGINCHLHDEHTVTINPMLSATVGGMKLMVAEPQAARAKEILDDAELQWLHTLPCPTCGHTGFRKEVSVKEFPGLWGKLKSMLANGQVQEIKVLYTCLHCHSELTDWPGDTLSLF